MDLVIDSKWIYYPKTEKLIENGRIIVEGSKIIYSGVKKGDINEQDGDHEYYNYENGIIIPGMINAHTHIPMTLQRGICDNKNLQTWLEYIWSVEPKLTPEDAYWGTMLGIAEMLASGTVGFNDQYFYSDQIAKAVQQTGIKAILARSIFFEGNPEADSMEEAFNIAKDVHTKWHGKDGRIWIVFGPHAPYTVNREWLEVIAAEARKRGTTLHTHLNETEYEVNESMKQHNMRPVEWMEEIGVLDLINGAAHCTYLSQNEINLLKKYNVNALHCPKSNAKIGSGFADIPKLLQEGVNVCLATDGQASNNKLDMFEEMAFEVLIHKGVHKDPTIVETADVLRMTTCNASSLFPENSYAGTLEVGTPADIVVVDLDSHTTTPIINPVSHLCHAVGREQVAMTVINGSILYHEGNFLTLDIKKVREEVQKTADRVIN